MRWVRDVLRGALLANGAFVVYLVWTHLNLLQIDLAGHIASAYLFRQGAFHQFYDGFFLGYVHGLSYPPLEDALIAGLSFFTGSDFELAYRVYLSGLVAFYLYAILQLSRAFQELLAQTSLLLFLLVVLNVDKPDLLRFQGLSFVDLLVTGLSAEVLGAVFLLLLLRRLISERAPRGVTSLLTLALLSHLVIGPVALLLVLVSAAFRRSRALAGQAALALGLSSFFLLPLLAYRSQLYASTIFRDPTWFLLLLSLLAFLLLARHRRLAAIPLTGLLLLIPETLRGLFAEVGAPPPFPSYHYYRLTVLALVLLAVAVAALLEAGADTPAQRWIGRAAALLFLAFLASSFTLYSYPLDSPRHQQLAPPGQGPAPWVSPAPEGGLARGLVIHPERPCDFYLDSLLTYQGHPLRFAKGLYWESSRNNVVLSSYLATLLGDSAVVLDYWYYSALPCSALSCVLDHFIADHGIGWLALPEGMEVDYLTPDRRLCLKGLTSTGTRHFRLQAGDPFAAGGRRYAVFSLHPRGQGLTSSAVETITPGRLVRLDSSEPWYFARVMQATGEACLAGEVRQQVFLYEDDYDRLQRDLAGRTLAGDEARISLVEHGRADYEIRVESAAPALFRVKLSYYPGFELLDAAGRSLPLYDGAGFIAGVGEGVMRLRWRRPPWMRAGYGLSLLLLAATGGRLLYRLLSLSSPSRRLSSPASPSR